MFEWSLPAISRGNVEQTRFHLIVRKGRMDISNGKSRRWSWNGVWTSKSCSVGENSSSDAEDIDVD